MKRPSIKVRADYLRQTALAGERIAEITWPSGAGCLLSVREHGPGQHRLEIYRADPGIIVVFDMGAKIREALNAIAKDTGVAPSELQARYDVSADGSTGEWVLTWRSGDRAMCLACAPDFYAAVAGLTLQLVERRRDG